MFAYDADRRIFWAWTAGTLLALLFACKSFQAPQTTEDKLQYAKASLTVVYQSIDQLAIQKRITKSEGLVLLDHADAIRTLLKGAEAALSVGLALDASRKLEIALSGLEELQALLKKRQL